LLISLAYGLSVGALIVGAGIDIEAGLPAAAARLIVAVLACAGRKCDMTVVRKYFALDVHG
jgi:hypothetical protein